MIKSICIASFLSLALMALCYGQDAPKTEMSATDRHRVREVLAMAFVSAIKVEDHVDSLLEEIGMLQIEYGAADVAGKSFAAMRDAERKNFLKQELYARQGRFDLYRKMFEHRTDYHVHKKYESLALDLAKAGKVKDAIKTARSIKDREVREQALYGICKAITDIGHFGEMKKIADELPKGLWKTWSYQHLARLKAESNEVDECLKLTHVIESEVYRSSLRKDLTAIFARKKDLKSLAKVIVDYPAARHRASAWLRCALLLANSGDLVTARKLHDRVKTSDLSSIDRPNLGRLMAHFGDFKSAVRLARKDSYDLSRVALMQTEHSAPDAFRTALLIEKPKYAAEALAKIAIALDQSGRKKEAQEAIKAAGVQARKLKGNVHFADRMVALTHVARANARMKQKENPELQLAAEAMQKADREDRSNLSCGVVAEALAEANRFAEAVAIAEWSDYAWDKTMHYYVRANLEDALRVSLDTKWESDKAKRAAITVEVWVSETGEFEKAVKWCKRQKPQVQAATLCAAIKGWQKFQGKNKPAKGE